MDGKELDKNSIAKGQYETGECYRRGDGVVKNDEVAFSWYLKAANQGHAQAQIEVIKCYKEGIGTAKDLSLAEFWEKQVIGEHNSPQTSKKRTPSIETFTKNAEAGDLNALHELGVIYAEMKDHATAIDYFFKATEKGHKTAKSNFLYLFKRLDDPKPNVSLYIKYAHLGSQEAQYLLGECYFTGNGIAKDIDMAINWFKTAAERGDVNAQLKLAECYMTGTGVEKNYELAKKWIVEPIKQNLAGAKQKNYELNNFVASGQLENTLETYKATPFFKNSRGKKKIKEFYLETFYEPISLDKKYKKLSINSCTFIDCSFYNLLHITHLHVFNTAVQGSFFDNLKQLLFLEKFVFIDEVYSISEEQCLFLANFLKEKPKMLRKIVVHAAGIHKLFNHISITDPLPNSLSLFVISDPKFLISELYRPRVEKFFLLNKGNSLQIGIVGFSTKSLVKQIISSLSCCRKNFLISLWLEYETKKVGERRSSGRYRGNLNQILSLIKVSIVKKISLPFERPTDYEYALMSRVSYKDDPNFINRQSESTFWLSVNGWKLYSQYCGKGGYRASIFINQIKRQIVIASRGTKIKNFGALYDDLAGVVLNGENVEQRSSAKGLLVQILNNTLPVYSECVQKNPVSIFPKCVPGCHDEFIVDVDPLSNPDCYQLSFTGHSLGAWLSEILVFEACLLGYHTSAVTFDSPGCKRYLQLLASKYVTEFKSQIDQLSITNYLACPNLGKKFSDLFSIY